MVQRNRTSPQVSEKVVLVVTFIAGTVLFIAGWKLFWFLTDDAYITFRYASNAILGHGYVWNPPPFRPVEGYTSFLWLVLLHAVWKLCGVAPPESANVMSLLFSLGSGILSCVMLYRIRWTERLRPQRAWFVAALALWLVSNRTWLAWSSSGLETGLFNFTVILWLFCSTRWNWRDSTRLLWASAAAALVGLTRPEGLLFCAATLFLALATIVSRIGGTLTFRRMLVSSLPLLAIPAHVAWRRSFYGEWLPNTYYAKVVSAWPESGLIYAASFALEYALWFGAAAVGLMLLLRLLPCGRPQSRPGPGQPSRIRSVTIAATTLTVVFQLSYYTFIVGGDHFEYRIYSYVVPLLFVSMIWALNQADARARTALLLAGLQILLAIPVPWSHWELTYRLETREETALMFVPIADTWGKGPWRWYAAVFDNTQSWLIQHLVGVRHQEHKVFCNLLQKANPTREEGLRMKCEGYPLTDNYCPGVQGWMLPHMCILDTSGLNDWVVARTPIEQTGTRSMAHERHPPNGYIESFRPNVSMRNREVKIAPLQPERTAQEIRRLERLWRTATMNGWSTTNTLRIAERLRTPG